MDLHARPSWQSVDFIADLHLQAACPQTLAAWRNYLQTTTANAVFILGDLFEAWIGDDCLASSDTFAAECAEALRSAAGRLDLFIMQGNRDFLMGQRLMDACGATALPDPSVLVFSRRRWLLVHGDAQCLADQPYQQFRAHVRSAAWQEEFLSRDLSERQAIARDIRSQSEHNKRQTTHYADLDTPACLALLHECRAAHMIHGHTHRPGLHMLDAKHTRTVLSDWDCEATPPRAEVLRLTRQHPDTPQRLSPAAAAAQASAQGGR